MVWYSHLFKNFPQFFVIHAVKGFGIVNKAKLDVFVELACFLMTQPTCGSVVKNPPAMQETWVQFLGWEDPLEKGKATQSSI